MSIQYHTLDDLKAQRDPFLECDRPRCHREVKADAPAARAWHTLTGGDKHKPDGDTFHFCSLRCLAVWAALTAQSRG